MAEHKASLACALRGRPCKQTVDFIEYERLEDGSLKHLSGQEAKPLCASCPMQEQQASGQLVRQMTVIHFAYGRAGRAVQVQA